MSSLLDMGWDLTPEEWKDEYFDYLDGLRESGETTCMAQGRIL